MTAMRPGQTETDKTQAEGHAEPGGHELGRLDKDLEAFEAGRKRARSTLAAGAFANEGYRVLGQLLSGVLGGLGLGWFFDRVAHTAPWGLVGGLLIGTGLSIWSTVRMASRPGAGKVSGPGPDRPASADDDDDDV